MKKGCKGGRMSDISELLKKLREDLNKDFGERLNEQILDLRKELNDDLDKKLDEQILDLRKNLNRDITRKLDRTDEKIKTLEQGMDARIDELKRDMNSRFDDIESRQRAVELDIEFLKGRHDFGCVSPYHASGHGYVAREPGPFLDSLQESRGDYENINPYY